MKSTPVLYEVSLTRSSSLEKPLEGERHHIRVLLNQWNTSKNIPLFHKRKLHLTAKNIPIFHEFQGRNVYKLNQPAHTLQKGIWHWNSENQEWYLMFSMYSNEINVYLNPHINKKVPNQPHPFPWTCVVSAQPEGCLSTVACHRNRFINLKEWGLWNIWM